MITRSFDPSALEEAVKDYPGLEELKGAEWLEHLDYVMLVAGENVSLFPCNYPGCYNGHYFFKARGKEARDLAIQMLGVMFKDYDAKIIKGTTPIHNKAARWMSRQLGFTSHGIIETQTGPHELFLMTYDDYQNKYKDIDNGS